MVDRLKILVVDDEENARVMLKQMTSLMGHDAILARNGLEAVALFESESPDIVLMDVMMPELDGYKATARIREIPTEKWVPVVYLSALERNTNLLRGMEAGGDDYIVKPVNLAELQAKIRALQRVSVLQDNLTKKRKLLEAYYQQAEEEARIGCHIMNRLTSASGLKDGAIEYWMQPLHHFSGDLLAAARTPANVLHVMLADAVGHGLPAALNVLPLAETFYSMTQRGFSITRIVGEMDRKIKQLLPVDRFVTATLVAINQYSGKIEIWNGGNPPPMFINAVGEVRSVGESRQLPLGLLRDGDCDGLAETLVYEGDGQIILFTDGLCEAQTEDGTYIDCERISASLGAIAPENRLASIISEFKAHLNGYPVQDDVSLMLVNVSKIAASTPPPSFSTDSQVTAVTDPAFDRGPGWRAQFRFCSRELRTLDAIPFLTSVVEKLETSNHHRRQIFMILSELFNNALEHGLLMLDSRMKSTPEGFEAYMLERTRRLSLLSDGMIEVALERVLLNGKAAIKIHVTDSGEGFDHAAIPEHAEAVESQLYGRGIMLVKSLCHGLQYLGPGNEVISYYLV